MNPIQDIPKNDPIGDDDDDFLLLKLPHPQSRTATKPRGSQDFKIHFRPRPRPASFDLLVDQDDSKKRKVLTPRSVNDDEEVAFEASVTSRDHANKMLCPRTPTATRLARSHVSSLVESKMMQSPAPTRFILSSTPPRFSLKPKPRYRQDSSNNVGAIVEGLAPLNLPPLPLYPSLSAREDDN